MYYYERLLENELKENNVSQHARTIKVIKSWGFLSAHNDGVVQQKQNRRWS
jgi:hypothetical protein